MVHPRLRLAGAASGPCEWRIQTKARGCLWGSWGGARLGSCSAPSAWSRPWPHFTNEGTARGCPVRKGSRMFPRQPVSRQSPALSTAPSHLLLSTGPASVKVKVKFCTSQDSRKGLCLVSERGPSSGVVRECSGELSSWPANNTNRIHKAPVDCCFPSVPRSLRARGPSSHVRSTVYLPHNCQKTLSHSSPGHTTGTRKITA